MKYRVTFEVDNSELFDKVSALNGDTSALGIRLVACLLTPQDIDFSTSVGLGVYGIEVIEAGRVK